MLFTAPRTGKRRGQEERREKTVSKRKRKYLATDFHRLNAEVKNEGKNIQRRVRKERSPDKRRREQEEKQ